MGTPDASAGTGIESHGDLSTELQLSSATSLRGRLAKLEADNEAHAGCTCTTYRQAKQSPTGRGRGSPLLPPSRRFPPETSWRSHPSAT